MKKTDCTGNHCLNVDNCCYVSSDAHRYCYRHHVFQTTDLVVDQLGLDTSAYSVSFQSRLGNDPWLLPATDQTLERLAKQGVKKLAVVCPAFVSDCLETLEEIGCEGKEIFEEHGGESYTLIPCLNTDSKWVDTVVSLINDTSMHQVLCEGL